MKRVLLLSIISALVVSLAAPVGAVFALEDGEPEVVLESIETPQQDQSSAAEEALATAAGVAPGIQEASEPPQPPAAPQVPDGPPVVVTPPAAPVMAEPITTPPLIVTTFDVSDGLEFVELYNQSSAPIAAEAVRLQASAGGEICSVGISSSGFIMPGEFLYTMSPTYGTGGLRGHAFSGECLLGDAVTRIELFVLGNRVQLIDEIALEPGKWGGHNGAWPKGARKAFTTIKQSGDFKKDYILIANAQEMYSSILYIPPPTSGGLKIVEILPNSRSCGPSDVGDDCEDYIKVYNDSEYEVNLALFRLRTGSRSANATATTSFNWHEPTLHPARDELVLPAGAYFLVKFRNDGVMLSLSNAESNVWLEDYFGVMVYQNVTYQGMDLAAARGKSWAYDRLNDVWRFGVPSLHGENILYNSEEEPGKGTVGQPSELVPCGENQYRSEETNRCRNNVVVSGPAPCREGQYRSEETNRCRSIATAAAAVLKPCGDGEFRNPETNRCKKIASSEDIALADCGEGRERNPLTNRCRNVAVAGALTDTMPFPVEKTTESTERFAGWWTLGIVVLLGAGYGMWEWREELLGVSKKVSQFLRSSK